MIREARFSLEDLLSLAPWLLLLFATLIDIGLAITAEAQLALGSYWALCVGLVGGVVATSLDVGRWLRGRWRLPSRWAELLLIVANGVALGTYGWAWRERHLTALHQPSARGLMAELTAMCVAGLGGWLAQELAGAHAQPQAAKPSLNLRGWP